MKDEQEHFCHNVYILWVNMFIKQLNTFLKPKNVLTTFSWLLSKGKPVDEEQMSQFSELWWFYSDLSLFLESLLKSSIQLWYLKFGDKNFPVPKNNLCIKFIARYTLFENNDEKGTKRWNLGKMRIVCRAWFVRFVSTSQKTFLRNVFARVGGFLTNSKNFFRRISLSTHIRKNWGLWRIVCRPLFVMFRKT